jgi:uncharacterized membrane protein YiaA
MCDDYLYIWHVCFGSPGSKNDISIMNNSDFFNAIRVGKWPPCHPDFAIAGKRVNWFYYLADGIYQNFKIFVCTIPSPKNLKEKVFSKHQEVYENRSKVYLGYCSSDFIFSIGLHVFGIWTIWLLLSMHAVLFTIWLWVHGEANTQELKTIDFQNMKNAFKLR